MNVLILGQGGREHALAYAISKSKLLSKLYVAKGNPGIAELATIVNINPLDNKAVKKFAEEHNIDLIIPGSEVYLENGITDQFINSSISVFGPTKKAAQIETSKEFAKTIMKKYDIPTADYEVFDNYNNAVEYLSKQSIPIVIKYDGLAAGKGVVVATSIEVATEALRLMLKDRLYGNGNVIIEEFLEGEEYSLMTFVHNNLVIPMPIAQDHKRLLENDLGPNTGGMGVYSPVPVIKQRSIDFAVSDIMKKTAQALVKENCNFTGFLYGGLIQTIEGPKVIEFNARFGDPEAEVILPKLESDFLEIIEKLLSDKIIDIKWNEEYFLGVVMASKGYPSKYDIKFKIKGITEPDSVVFHMGTKLLNGELLTNGGRVLLVTGRGKTIKEAKENSYKNVQKINCENLIYRKDIGAKSL